MRVGEQDCAGCWLVGKKVGSRGEKRRDDDADNGALIGTVGTHLPKPHALWEIRSRRSDIRGYREQAISVIVLLAEDHECRAKAGRDLKALYAKDGLTVVHCPIVDFGIPNSEDLRVALDATVWEAQSGRHIVIHCSAGIGRTGLFTACLAKKLLNLSGKHAIEWVRRHITGAVETREQRQFVIRKTF